MNTKNFDNREIGFEVKNVKDILAAKSLGFSVCDENGYYFDDLIIDTDEDGNEIEREPTEEEQTNLAVTELNDGGKVYAVFSVPDGYQLDEVKATTLQSDFFVRQYVYIIQDNQIVKAQVYKVQIVRRYNGSAIGTETKYEVRWSKGGRAYSAIVSEGNIFDTIEKLTEHLTSNIIG